VIEHSKSSHEPASAKEPIVFVIDDDASMRRALTNLFQSVGLKVEVFGSASEMLQSKLPDAAAISVAERLVDDEASRSLLAATLATGTIRSAPTKSGCKHLSSTKSIARFDFTC
jgi:ActR/RegA family two-component response regulator